MSAFTKKERISLCFMLVFLLLFLCYYTLELGVPQGLDEKTAAVYDLAYTRLLSGLIFTCLFLYLGYPLLSLRHRKGWGACVALLASAVVAVNNFPIVSLVTGDMQIDAPPLRIALFSAACLGIGLFEEFAFRGIVFPTLCNRLLPILQKRRAASIRPHRLPVETVTAVLSIFLTSAVFGLLHVLNLFSGGSPVAVLMQIGYSFLIGGMCAIVLLYTRSLVFPVLIHAVYDFGGLMDAHIATGTRWDPLTVTLTAVFGVTAAVILFLLLLRVKPEAVTALTNQGSPREAAQEPDL